MLFTIPSLVKSGKIKLKQPPAFCKEMEGKTLLFHMHDFPISPDVLKSQSSSSFAKGNARGCAKLASILANGGEDLLSQRTWTEMHSEPRKEAMIDTPGKIQ